MGFEYARMWAIYNTVTNQMEGGRSYSNLTHHISKMGCLGIPSGIGLSAYIQN
jgi:hypothetical protein